VQPSAGISKTASYPKPWTPCGARAMRPSQTPSESHTRPPESATAITHRKRAVRRSSGTPCNRVSNRRLRSASVDCQSAPSARPGPHPTRPPPGRSRPRGPSTPTAVRPPAPSAARCLETSRRPPGAPGPVQPGRAAEWTLSALAAGRRFRRTFRNWWSRPPAA